MVKGEVLGRFPRSDVESNDIFVIRRVSRYEIDTKNAVIT